MKFCYNEENIKKVAYAEAKVIAQALGVNTSNSIESEKKINGYYRVITGSFKTKELAEKQCEELRSKGYKPFISYYE